MILFSTREIVDAFRARNVVFESSASISKNGDLILRSVVEFGENGSMKRQAIIPTNELHSFSVATAIGKYQAEVLDVIGAFENFREWLKGDKRDTFSEFLDYDSPLFFHGKLSNNKVVFSAFGPTLYNLELTNSVTQRMDVTPFGERFAALADKYRHHLNAIDGLGIAELIKNQLHLQGKVA